MALLAAVVAVLAWAGPATAGPAPTMEQTPAAVRVLDVPYVPQSGQLCGGAVLAMVLRYWGETGVLAEDFTSLVEAGQDGIRTGALGDAVRARGWAALPLSGTRSAVVDQLARGRPVIVLLRTGAGTYHYVVLLAWTGGSVVLHDPSRGPFRVVKETAFVADWSAAGSWALLVVPPQDPAPPAATAAPAPPDVPDSSSTLVRAGQRFRAGDWAGASRLAGQVLALDPHDAHARRLLAGSRFLADDLDGALAAWNHLDEPRIDLTRIDGLGHTRYAAVATQLDLPPGRLLTPQAFRRAGRRLAELPVRAGSRLDYTPLPGGVARVNVFLLERPLLAVGPWDLLRLGARAVVEREVMVEVAGPTRNGELWTAAWRWWPDRPRIALALAAPAVGGRPGIWRVAGCWERQTYAAGLEPGGSASAGQQPVREERRRTAVSFADWFTSDLRLEFGVALDRWVDQGAHLALAAAVQTRWARDRLTASVAGERWQSLEGRGPLAAGAVDLRWRAGGPPGWETWLGDLGLAATTRDAPLALWSGAGTGHGRTPLLRAHPLLEGGVISGPVFGRSLLHATIERQAWPWQRGLLQVGWAVFLDGARAWETGREAVVPWQVDGGAGLRLRGLGTTGQVRIDVAHGFSDGNRAGSIAWQQSY